MDMCITALSASIRTIHMLYGGEDAFYIELLPVQMSLHILAM